MVRVLFLGRAVLFPHALDYGEGPLLDQALRITRGEPLYRVPGTNPPWTVSNYPPVFPAVEAALAAVFGPAYWYGRAVSVAALAGSALLLGSIVERLTGDRFAATVAGLLLPALPWVGLWAAFARVDLLALVLSLAGLACVVRRPSSSAALAGAVVLLSLAVLTRQTYVLAAPVAAVSWTLRVDRRRALALAVGLLGSVLVAGGLLQVVSGGAFWFDVVTANVNELSWDWVGYWLLTLPGLVPVVLVVAVGYVVVAARRRLPGACLVVPYLLLGAAQVVTTAKVGSSVNYLLELGAGLCLAVGGLLAQLRPRRRAHAAALVLLACQTSGWLVWPPDWFAVTTSYIDDEASRTSVAAVVHRADGDVLADQEMGELPLAGRPILLQPFELTQLARAGRWDQTSLVSSIEAQRYAAILVYTIPEYPLEQERWTPEMLAAIDRAYVAGPRIGTPEGGSVVYLPRRR